MSNNVTCCIRYATDIAEHCFKQGMKQRWEVGKVPEVLLCDMLQQNPLVLCESCAFQKVYFEPFISTHFVRFQGEHDIRGGFALQYALAAVIKGSLI